MARKKKRGKPDYRIVWFFLAIGVASFAVGAWGAANGARTWCWPRVEAEIVTATHRVIETERRDQREADKRHTFAVSYVYTVDGQRYLSHNIEPDDFGMQSSGDAVKLANAYPVGSKGQAAYDPANPAVAYLKPGPSSFSLVLMGIGVAFALMAGLARRMVRVGPGGDDEDKPKAAPVKSKVTLDPEIASYYPKRTDSKAAP
jgi:hypothetical protein